MDARQYVDGADLGAVTVPRCPRRAAVTRGLRVGGARGRRGVAAAHALCGDDRSPAPVLHRDLSPQNVLVSRHRRGEDADFGIAWALTPRRATTTGAVVGNVRYMAPEQIEGRAPASRRRLRR
ncbi:MAG: protein kinase [Polyangiales bacterium]